MLKKQYQFDVKVFSKLLFSVFIPVLVFIELYRVDILIDILVKVLLFHLLFYASLISIVMLFVKVSRIEKSKVPTIFNSVMFYNTGNYGLPLILVIFPSNSSALAVQVIIVVIQALLPFTVGVVAINSTKKSKRSVVMDLLKLPVVYAVILGIISVSFDIPLPQPLIMSLNYISDGFIAMALMTLGLQLGDINWKFHLKQVMTINVIRLLISPVIAVIILFVLEIDGVMAQVLIISSALPTALNVMLLDIEYNNEPEFSSQIVLTSTVMSILTMTAVVYFVQIVY